MDENENEPPVAKSWPRRRWYWTLAAYFGIRTPLAKCSFCGQQWSRERPLAEGFRNVYICRSCVDHSTAILDAELRRLGDGAGAADSAK